MNDLFDETKPYGYRCGEKPIFSARLPMLSSDWVEFVSLDKQGKLRTHYSGGRYLLDAVSDYDLINLPPEPKLVQFEIEDIKPGMVFRPKKWCCGWLTIRCLYDNKYIEFSGITVTMAELFNDWLVSTDGAVTFGPCGKVAK